MKTYESKETKDEEVKETKDKKDKTRDKTRDKKTKNRGEGVKTKAREGRRRNNPKREIPGLRPQPKRTT
jgi:hypothetical protein